MQRIFLNQSISEFSNYTVYYTVRIRSTIVDSQGEKTRNVSLFPTVPMIAYAAQTPNWTTFKFSSTINHASCMIYQDRLPENGGFHHHSRDIIM